MNLAREKALQDLKRLLANGPLTAVPKRPSDQDILMAMAAARFEARGTYTEREVNGTLKAWLDSFCEPFGIDHVTLRRMMVDAGFLSRTSSGSSYRINVKRAGEMEAVRTLEPVALLAEIRGERESRKRRRATT